MKNLDFGERITHFILEKGDREGLEENTIIMLVPRNPRTPTFYILPEIHKTTRPPLGCLICASFGSPTE